MITEFRITNKDENPPARGIHSPSRWISTRILILLSIPLFLSSCATTNLFETPEIRGEMVSDTSAFAFNPEYQYQIRRDDKISISIWDHDDLSIGSLYGIYNSNEVYGKWVMVDARGEIPLPQYGNFRIEGLTVIEAKDTLKHIYSNWVLNPIIDVKVLNREITMLGELKNPGSFLIEKERVTLIEMLGKAGDLDFYANKRNIKVLRQSGEDVQIASIDLTSSTDFLSRNIQLLPGDVVVVPSRKNKEFDKRVATVLPFTSIATATAVLMGTL
ncbi:MAG: polysaccharide biosynthesis/export family protein [Saprospiraceae bacterium]|nr:polysaccharide biosynthesis/export family protein [Saprospiraceae bacterium]